MLRVTQTPIAQTYSDWKQITMKVISHSSKLSAHQSTERNLDVCL